MRQFSDRASTGHSQLGLACVLENARPPAHGVLRAIAARLLQVPVSLNGTTVATVPVLPPARRAHGPGRGLSPATVRDLMWTSSDLQVRPNASVQIDASFLPLALHGPLRHTSQRRNFAER